MLGKRHDRMDWAVSRLRYVRLGHNWNTNDPFQYAVMRKTNNIRGGKSFKDALPPEKHAAMWDFLRFVSAMERKYGCVDAGLMISAYVNCKAYERKGNE